MKRTCLVLVLITTTLLLSAQQWEIGFGSPETFTSLFGGIMDSEQNIVFCGKSGPDRTDQYPYFIRVDQEGNHQSYALEDEQFHNLDKCSLVQMENGNFFVVGPKDGNALYAVVLDPDFNVLSCKRYDKPEDALDMKGGHLLLDHDGTVVLAGCYRPHANSWGNHYFLRFNSDADTIASRFHTTETQHNITTFDGLTQLLSDPQTGGYILLGNGIHGVESVMRFDRDFNYVSGYQLYLNRESFYTAYSDHWLSDGRLLVMGRAHSNWDNNLEIIGMTRVGLDGPMEPIERIYCSSRDTILQTQNRYMAYYNDTTIYGAIGCLAGLGGPATTRICLFDTDKELLGLKTITTEESDNYRPGSIFPTPDGGCIISVMEHYAFGQNHVKGKIIKMRREDFNPIPWSVKEVPQEALKALAFPNPAKDELHIDISGLPENKEHRIQITDALGHVCMSRIIRGEGNLLTVDVSSLKPGVYIYTVFNSEKEIVRNKFVKE
ncbi:MAG: T9SS type A sorting domain-containing protein [Bacteroidales bacterium]|nr:T9SS type A sorting domain-containing protein [Bacteroidales bacterium]